MKTFSNLAICLVLLATITPRAAAQETFAPLISENCVAFVHIDFNKLEIDTVKTALYKVGEEILRDLGFDDESFTATTRELAVELEKLDILVRPYWETVTKELGITEIAVIFDPGLLATSAPPAVAIPWKNKTNAQLEKLVALLQAPEGNIVKIDGFLVLTESARWTDEITDWAKSITPAPANSPIHEALESVAGAEIKIVAALPESLRAMVRRGVGMPSDMPQEVHGLLMFAAQRVQWASACVSFSEFFGGEPRENSDVLLTIKTTRPTDAMMLRGMLEQLIEFGVNAARFGLEYARNDFDAEAQNAMALATSPVAISFTKGLLRTLLPDAEGDKLLFRVKGSAGSSQVVVVTAGVGVALLLPAVQAAREAARRMQCANHIKQIVLALHVYHDAHNAFPPLYTVDANGKPLHSWRVLILPYMEQTALYQQIRLDEPWDSEHNKRFHSFTIPGYRCPSNPSWSGNAGGLCAYACIAGEVFEPAKAAGRMTGNGLQHITDGTSNTLAIVEVREAFNWMDPTADVTLNELLEEFHRGGRVGSYHTGGMNVGICDGSVRFISETIDRTVLRALGTKAGGEGGESLGF